MHNPLTFYKEEKNKFTGEVQKIKKQLTLNSGIRLFVFVVAILSVYFIFQKPFVLTLGVTLVVAVISFVFLIVKHTNLQHKSDLLNAKIQINNIEINTLNRQYEDLDTGEEFKNPDHFYSNDIDLFGKGSFFQYINRTTTDDGKIALAKLLTSNGFFKIDEKQKALKELSGKIKWRQNFSALSEVFTNKINTNILLNWVLTYTSKLPSFLNFLSKTFSITSLVLIGLVIMKMVSFSVLLLWFFVGLTITGIYFKPIQKLYTNAGNAKEIFKQYYVLLACIEEVSFSSILLQEKQEEITSENKKASIIFKEFSKILDAFDQRNNIFFAIFGNGLFLWDVQNGIKTENWIHKYNNTVEKWFKAVCFFDMQNSLANFVYNHPNYIFPELSEEKNVVFSESLGHPLLDPKKRVDNNFQILNEEFFIVTGANMAGKSTFLRTVALSIVMGNCGLPVCASSFKYKPIKLITSMRTSDSLNDDESYFYSELKRLKFIVDATKTENYFIILDEILKGTNSKDKAIGSKKFVVKLNASKSTGIIATHDVSLCELSEEYKTIQNHYFDAEIVDNELFFDYKMKNGVCKNMNASFLLQKMEII